MYNLFRKIHLYSGLVLLWFVVMYFVTGLVMTHHELFPAGEPIKTKTEQPLSYAGEWNADDLGAYLKATFDLPGRLESAKVKDGAWTFVYGTAGQWHQVVVPSSHDKVVIERTQPPLATVMTRMHRLHLYKGGPFYILWAVVYDLASLAMIVFAVTGVYMWYKLTQRRWFGWLLLGTGCSFTVATVLYFLYMP